MRLLRFKLIDIDLPCIPYVIFHGGNQMSDVAELTPEEVPDSIIEEVVRELRAINVGQDVISIRCACGEHNKALSQVIADVEQRTPDGMEHIRAHIELTKRLNGFREGKPWWKFW